MEPNDDGRVRVPLELPATLLATVGQPAKGGVGSPSRQI